MRHGCGYCSCLLVLRVDGVSVISCRTERESPDNRYHSGRRRLDPHRWRPLEREVIDMSKVLRTFSTERSCSFRYDSGIVLIGFIIVELNSMYIVTTVLCRATYHSDFSTSTPITATPASLNSCFVSSHPECTTHLVPSSTTKDPNPALAASIAVYFTQ